MSMHTTKMLPRAFTVERDVPRSSVTRIHHKHPREVVEQPTAGGLPSPTRSWAER